MQIGMVGLGKMGGNMAARMLRGGHQVVVFDRNEDKVQKAESEGAVGASSLEDLVGKLNAPRFVWIMVRAGEPTGALLHKLGELLVDGDTVVDGGNSNYKDTRRRAEELKEKGISLVDVGTSGGIWGFEEGYSMMIGGERSPVEQLQPVFKTLAPGEKKGWGHVGACGAGHFVKMVHNGIEYGLMQAYAEGFEILRAKEEYDLDLFNIAEIWRYGSVVRSWLLDLTAEALREDADLSSVKDWVADSGEGRWTVAEAVELDIPAPVITLSLLMRLVSRQDERYSAKLLAALRNRFGGHAVKIEDSY